MHLLHPVQSASQPSCPNAAWMSLPLSLFQQTSTDLSETPCKLVVRRLSRICFTFKNVRFSRNAIGEEVLGLDVGSRTVNTQPIDIMTPSWANCCCADGCAAFNCDCIEDLCDHAICVHSDSACQLLKRAIVIQSINGGSARSRRDACTHVVVYSVSSTLLNHRKVLPGASSDYRPAGPIDSLSRVFWLNSSNTDSLANCMAKDPTAVLAP